MQRPPTDPSAGGLVGDPLLITAHKNLLAEVLTQDSEGSGNSTPPSSSAEAGEVADVVAQSCLQSNNFWTVGDFAGLPKRPLMTLPPLSAKVSLTRGRRFVLYKCISHKSA